MKIILLRHEERGIDIGFYSNLTENGILKSYFLASQLKKMKIDIIFSSPFTRTVETIYPYCTKYKKNINIEYGLYEYLHNPYFLFVPWYYTYNDLKDDKLKKIVNINYKSIVNKNDFSILEDELCLEKRIKKFFNSLFLKHKNKTILLVTHKGVINKIKDIYLKETNMSEDFDMGSFQILNTLD